MPTPVAIIGMGCIFPKAHGLKEYWRLLFHGIDAITDIPETHWSANDYYHEDPKKPDHIYCKRGGFVSAVSYDPSEFGIPPNVLEATDTSQLLGLVVAKMALEDAGYGNGKPFNRDRTSVLLGVTGTQELVIPLGSRLGHPIWRRALENSGVSQDQTQEVIDRISDSYVSWQENSFPGLLGNVVAGRISNRLDLGGTNTVVDAACASSMSAVNLAILDLVAERSDMAITGGVDMINDIFMHMCFSKTSVLSHTGDARPFSENADGTVLGEGIGMLVLKRLADAEKDGDRIYAVIKSVGSSSDGKSQSIYAPNAKGQARALRMAYQHAEILPSTVDLIEAHGTGTRVGDAVEFSALKEVFEESGRNGNKCALGSVKSMIGHTKAAAGSAGLIKAVLALHHKVLPPTLKADKPDPKLAIHNSPFYLNTTSRPWISPDNHPRRSGVSAFGFGGSNFHVVVEEYAQDKHNISWDGSVEIIAFSADTAAQLKDKINDFKQLLNNRISGTIAYQAYQSRKSFSTRDPHRILFVIEQKATEPVIKPDDIIGLFDAAMDKLSNDNSESSWRLPDIFYSSRENTAAESPEKIAFIFPGQGSQYSCMGRDIVCAFPETGKVLENADRHFSVLSNAHSKHLSDYIYPVPDYSKDSKIDENALRNTAVAQPAIGAVSLAMLKSIQWFGLKPDAVCGHSFGELTALHSAGWIDEDTFLSLSAARGRFMAECGKNKGSMLAVKAPLNELAAFIKDNSLDLVLANRNAPEQGVLSGSTREIDRAEKLLADKKIRSVKLPVSAAFHSRLVQDAVIPFREILNHITITPTDIQVYSNTTASPYPADPEAVKKLLGDQLLHPVNFVNEIEAIYESGVRTFVEIGPKTVLTGLVKSILNGRDVHAVSLDSSSGKKFGISDLARALCHLAALGYHVNLNKWEDAPSEPKPQRMSIPVTGANYKPQIKKQINKITPDDMKKKQPITPALHTNTAPVINHNTNQDIQLFQRRAMSTDNLRKKDVIIDAFKVVQETLKSMQMLQTQTAEAHKKFLETQTEASRSLQMMIDQTRHLTAAAMGITPLDHAGPAEIKHTEITHQSNKIRSEIKPDIKTVAKISDPVVIPSEKPDNPKPVQHTTAETDVEKILLETVSRLTGYPVEMLGMDMNIEADLGIDSIKRVEILSTIEENIPGLPSVPPDVMAELKTLGQIAEYLCGQTGGAQPEAPSEIMLPDTPQEHASGNLTVPIDSPVKGNNEIQQILLEVVSRLTGYPVEMLGLDMDIEADLGIDSIKRVEILSSVEEQMPGLPSVPPDMMAELKTLGRICDFLGSTNTNNEESIQKNILVESSVSYNINGKVSHRSGSNVERKTISIIEQPFLSGQPVLIPNNRKVFIVDDASGLANAIAKEFASRQIKTVLISQDQISSYANGTHDLSEAAGLVIIPPKDLTKTDTTDSTLWNDADEVFLKQAFAITKQAAPALLKSSETQNKGAIFASITHLDGFFGFKGQGIARPLHGGLAGLVKTASIEWEHVCCRALDISPDWDDTQTIATLIVSELLNNHPSCPVEVGLDADKRYILELTPAEFPKGDINLDQNDVVVITGGARGVTAACAKALAVHSKPVIILLGRSPQPHDEPEWLKPLEHEADIKKAILSREFSGNNATPKKIEHSYKMHMANREIINTIEKLTSAGSQVRYYSVDIRKPDEVISVFEEIQKDFGLITALIHGAGVLEDKLIIDKTSEQFESVFDTKARGFKVILDAIHHNPLKYIILFSSVTARVGNKGQADYAVANEVLNKIACQQALLRPDCRVAAINWGPWDGGMVSPALKKEFTRNNIRLIPMDAGAECMLLEMMKTKNDPIEVVIGAEFSEKQTPDIKTPSVTETHYSNKNSLLSLTFKQVIDTKNHPVLGSHILNGKPVVPFALMTEWLGHGALHSNPGLYLSGIDDMRLLSGIKLDDGKKLIRLFAGKTKKTGNSFEVDVEIRDGVKDGSDVIHTRAKAILADKLSTPPVFDEKYKLESISYNRSVKEIYEDILFHGIDLHGIKEIISYSENGMKARLSSAPQPNQWISEPLRTRWIADPLVLDSAFQMATLWCYEQKGVVSLPAYSKSYRQYCAGFSDKEVTAILEVTETTDHKMTGNFTFLDQNNVVLARLEGYEAIMDASLNNAFKSGGIKKKSIHPI